MDVVEMIVPLAGLLVIYSLATCVVAIIIGKLVGYSPAVSCAIACTSMIGYPGTEILSNEVCDSLDCDDETRAKALEYIMPKMIVGGLRHSHHCIGGTGWRTGPHDLCLNRTKTPLVHCGSGVSFL